MSTSSPSESDRPERATSNRRLLDTFQVALFAIALLLPSVGYLLGANDFELLAENRRPAPRPEWPKSWAEAQAFPAAFERYFDDHFGFRSYLVGRDKRLEWLGRRTEVEIQVGREGWLFKGNAHTLTEFVCTTPSAEDRSSWIELARERGDRFEGQSTRLYWVLAPNKHTVHGEYLPPEARTELASATRDCILPRAIMENTGFTFIDLRERLRAEVGSEVGATPLYHATDTHWNELGAAHAARAIVDAVRMDYPDVPAFSLDDYEVEVEAAPFEGDLAKRLRVYGEHYEEPFRRLRPRGEPRARRVDDSPWLDLRVHSREDPIVEFATGDTSLPTARVYHDSFGYALMALLAEHFESIRFINSNSWLDPDPLDGTPPDVVISVFLEAKLRGPAPPIAR